MEDLRNEILNCTGCNLHKSRNHVIVGEGFEHAGVFLIGEGPGAEEDRLGHPFVGKSGQLLDKILLACGFTRESHVFISNIVRCRPPENRVPTDIEVQTCIRFLYREIEEVNPKILVTLGSTALKNLFGDPNLRITRLRGKWMEWNGRLVMPVYQLSALLRNPDLKRDTWEDYKKVVFKYRELVNASHYSANV